MKSLLIAATAALLVVGAVHFVSEQNEEVRKLRDLTIEPAWVAWKQTYSKSYGTDSEETYRKAVFARNYQYVAESNADKTKTYTLELNKFADLEGEEFRRMYTSGDKIRRADHGENVVELPDVEQATGIDWVARGKITEVKNQGQCGSCWAFSTTGALEGRYAVAQNAAPVELSEQELVDCSTQNNGCSGGLMDYGFAYVASHNGLCLEKNYGYTAREGNCHSSSCGSRSAANHSYADVGKYDEDGMKKAVAGGPVSVAIEADQKVFQLYKGGVLTGSECGYQLDHGVLVVGYGTDNGTDFWKVKNSWGGSWGESGYIRLQRNSHVHCNIFGFHCAGVCGISTQPSYPTF